MQVAHALSMVTAVEAAIPPEVAAMNQQQAKNAQEDKPAAYGSSAMKTQLRFRVSVEVPLIAVLCLVRVLSSSLGDARQACHAAVTQPLLEADRCGYCSPRLSLLI